MVYLAHSARRGLFPPSTSSLKGGHPALDALIDLIAGELADSLQSRSWQLTYYTTHGRYGYLAIALARKQKLLESILDLVRSDFGTELDDRARWLSAFRFKAGFDSLDYVARLYQSDVMLTSQLVAYGPSELPKAIELVRRLAAKQDPLIQVATGSLVRATVAMGMEPTPLTKEFQGKLPGNIDLYLNSVEPARKDCLYYPGSALLSVFDAGALLPVHRKPDWKPPRSWLQLGGGR